MSALVLTPVEKGKSEEEIPLVVSAIEFCVRKEKRVFLSQVFLLCHLVDQTMLLESLCLNGKEKGRLRGTFLPLLCPKSPHWWKENYMLFVEIVMNAISVTTRLNNFSLESTRGARAQN